MGFFSNNNIMSYRGKEMERLERNLQKLAKGEMDIDCEVALGDDSVRTEREAFIKLNQYILKIKGTINDLAADVKGVSDNINDGNISYKMDASKYSGIYSNVGKDINAAFEAVEEPLTDINNVLGKMAFNDFTLSMGTNYKGSFAKTAGEINDVLKRLLAVQNVAVKISQGDISELENYRKVGKRSENDHLVPALTKMMESIESLINETTALEKAAIEGNLGARGQADKFKGEYVGIINGINKTLDSVVNPMREVKEAMSQIGVGNLKVSLKGSYSGEYEELINSVNT
ncbi:MAG TPA: HAMP domain-containing protein, partial [Negativicutes bacterium]|nr:HAMP domain-containing protein [Negativicutes bacterium]